MLIAPDCRYVRLSDTAAYPWGMGLDAMAWLRIAIYTPAAFGLVYLVWTVWLLARRSHRTGCANALHIAASLSHRWRLTVLEEEL